MNLAQRRGRGARVRTIEKPLASNVRYEAVDSGTVRIRQIDFESIEVEIHVPIYRCAATRQLGAPLLPTTGGRQKQVLLQF